MAPTTYRKLQTKHVLVIGGSSGIGAAVAEAALSDGALVTISSSSQPKIDTVISNLSSAYPDRAGSIRGIAQDLLRSRDSDSDDALKSDIDSIFQRAVSAQSGAPINHVIFTAADALSLGTVDQITPSMIIKASHMRMIVPIIVAGVAAKYLPVSNQSSITLTSGSADTKPAKNWSVISYFAGGLVSLTRGLAVDLAPIRVNVVRAGVVDTALWGYMSDEAKEAFKKETEEKVLTGVMGRVEDVAEAYIWLIKDGNATGTVAGTDSGALLV